MSIKSVNVIFKQPFPLPWYFKVGDEYDCDIIKEINILEKNELDELRNSNV